jgi:flavorubredoxin
MSKYDISKAVRYIGVDDRDIDLFEGQYAVPEGMSYNSYLILDEKVAVLDTADRRRTDAWLANLEAALGGRKVDYLVSLHVEPDHSGSIKAFAEKYPEADILCSAKAVGMMGQFFDCAGLKITGVKEGDVLALGSHALQFIMAPMVHWPEVMVAYEQREKIFFSADGFGKFGALDAEEDWACEARRYYFNIVGKYGTQVQNLLKKAAALDIQTICPPPRSHPPEGPGLLYRKYQTWSAYAPEDTGIFVAYASIHGGTAAAVERFAEMLRQKGAPRWWSPIWPAATWLRTSRTPSAYDRLVVAGPHL